MPDGPPWISKIYPDQTHSSNMDPQTGFHLELDENRHWVLSASVFRPPGNSYEISINWSIPGGFNVPQKQFLSMNDSNPQTPLYWDKFWFPNEDVWVDITWKPQVDPSDPIWRAGDISAAELFTDSPASRQGRAVMWFHIPTPDGKEVGITVQIACMFTRDEEAKASAKHVKGSFLHRSEKVDIDLKKYEKVKIVRDA